MMGESKSIGEQIVKKISSLIKPCFLESSKLSLQENISKLDSIVIKLDNNPWRNGVIKGNIIFARIKPNGDQPYINIKNKFSDLFSVFDIVQLSVPESESQYDWIRIELQSFLKLLNNPSDSFIQAINDMYIGCIEFPAFGCCSKYAECQKEGKCLHTDQLYATACQYRKNVVNIHINHLLSTVAVGIGNYKKSSSERTHKGESFIDFPERYVVIDLETTGLMPNFDEIIEIAALKVNNGEIIDTFQQLIKPEGEIDSFIQNLTGITNEMVADAPKIDDVIPLFDTFVGNDIVVGHNVNFDVNFLYENYKNTIHRYFTNNFIDIMRIARKIYPELPHHRLKDIVKQCEIEETTYHRALQDCEYTYKCYQFIKNKIIHDYKSIENFKAIFSKSGKSKNRKIDLTKLTVDNYNFDETHPLYKKECVFTGTLEKYTRRQAAQIIVNLGGTCGNTVTKKTNYLIMGNNDYCATIKDGKSSKQKKAEEYKLKGQDIEIIPESVFYDMIDSN